MTIISNVIIVFSLFWVVTYQGTLMRHGQSRFAASSEVHKRQQVHKRHRVHKDRGHRQYHHIPEHNPQLKEKETVKTEELQLMHKFHGDPAHPDVRKLAKKSRRAREMNSSEEAYNPNLGYDPYWADGHWVFKYPFTKPGDNGTTTTTELILICGEDCEERYRRIGKICAVYTYGYNLPQKQYWSGSQNTYTEVDTLGIIWKHGLPAFRTLPSFCRFLQLQCEIIEEGKEGETWNFVHLGPCITNPEILLPRLDIMDSMSSRLYAYRSEANEYDDLFSKAQKLSSLAPSNTTKGKKGWFG